MQRKSPHRENSQPLGSAPRKPRESWVVSRDRTERAQNFPLPPYLVLAIPALRYTGRGSTRERAREKSARRARSSVGTRRSRRAFLLTIAGARRTLTEQHGVYISSASRVSLVVTKPPTKPEQRGHCKCPSTESSGRSAGSRSPAAVSPWAARSAWGLWVCLPLLYLHILVLPPPRGGFSPCAYNGTELRGVSTAGRVRGFSDPYTTAGVRISLALYGLITTNDYWLGKVVYRSSGLCCAFLGALRGWFWLLYYLSAKSLAFDFEIDFLEYLVIRIILIVK